MKRIHLHISVRDLTFGEATSYGEDEVLPEPDTAACCGPVAAPAEACR